MAGPRDGGAERSEIGARLIVRVAACPGQRGGERAAFILAQHDAMPYIRGGGVMRLC